MNIKLILLLLIVAISIYAFYSFYSFQNKETLCKDCNVILIALDTLRLDHLGIYGYAKNTSLNIDKLTSSGIVVKKATTQATYTLPSFMSVFTSLYPSVHSIGNIDDNQSLNLGIITLPEILHKNGYYTNAFVDAPYVGSFYGFSRGFDSFDEKSVLEGNGGIAARNERIYPLLDNLKSKKFFLFLHYMDIHAPYGQSEQYVSAFEKNYSGNVDLTNKQEEDLRILNLTTDDWNHIVAGYDGNILYTDYYLGQLFSKINQLGLSNNTIIIIFSDHGEELNEHGSLGHGYTLFEEVTHVPLILSIPHSYSRTLNQPVELIDIAPTLLNILGIPAPSQFQGIDFLNSPISNRTIHSELGSANLSSIRMNNIKVIYNRTSDKLSLYNLDSDPHEQRNIFNEKDREYYLSKFEEFNKSNLQKLKSLNLVNFTLNQIEATMYTIANYDESKSQIVSELNSSAINSTWFTNGIFFGKNILISPKSSFESGYITTNLSVPKNTSSIFYISYATVKSPNPCPCSNILLTIGVIRNSSSLILYKELVDYQAGEKSVALNLSPFEGRTIDIYVHSDYGQCPGYCGFSQLNVTKAYFASYSGNLQTLNELNREALNKLGYVT